MRSSRNSFFDCHNPKLISRPRVSLSHLTEHKFKYSFQDTVNPLCNSEQGIESSADFFVLCPFINERRTLLSTYLALIVDC